MTAVFIPLPLCLALRGRVFDMSSGVMRLKHNWRAEVDAGPDTIGQ